MRSVVENTIANKGKDDRNFIELWNNQRRGTSLHNLLGKDISNILENSTDIQKDFSTLIENFGKDLGINLKVAYGSNGNMPKDSESSIGSAFVETETKKATIVINADKVTSTSEYIGTVFEELSHILDGIAGRQDVTVINDKTTNEKGLESLGKPINDYFTEKYSKEMEALDKKDEITLSSTNNLKNVPLGEKYGDVEPISVYLGALISEPDFQLDLMSLTDSGSEFLVNPSLGTGTLFALDLVGTAVPGVQATVIRRSGEVFLKTVDGAVYRVTGKYADDILKIVGNTKIGKATVKVTDDVVQKLFSVMKKVDSKIDNVLGTATKASDNSATKVGTELIENSKKHLLKKEDTLENILSMSSENVVSVSKSNIGSKLVTENAYKLTDNTSKYASMIEDIIKNGDPKGLKTESIISDLFKNNPDFRVHHGKYGSNHGIDHFVENIKTGEVWIIDSKQIAKSKTFEAGAMKVIENAAGKQRQLSENWIETVANSLPEKENKMLMKAINDKKIRTAVSGINKETGDILFLPIMIENKSKR